MTERLPTASWRHVSADFGSLSVMNAFTAPSCSLWEKSAETCLYEAVGSLSVMNAFTAEGIHDRETSNGFIETCFC
jgi:hypothetical protein